MSRNTVRENACPAVRWLAGILLLGGVGRIVSMAVHGQPQWFQIALTVTEFALPPPYFRLADADEKAKASRTRPVALSEPLRTL